MRRSRRERAERDSGTARGADGERQRLQLAGGAGRERSAGGAVLPAAPGSDPVERRVVASPVLAVSALTPHNFFPRVERLLEPAGAAAPRIILTDDCYRRICLIVELAPKEVGWVGTVDRLANGDFFIDEVFVPEQDVTGVETDPSFDGLYQVMNDLVEAGEEGMQKIERLRFWGHSHVHMGTSPSGTDENTPMQFRDQGLPWFVRGIFNKLGRAEFTVYLFEEGRRFIDVPWSVIDIDTGLELPVRIAQPTHRLQVAREPGFTILGGNPAPDGAGDPGLQGGSGGSGGYRGIGFAGNGRLGGPTTAPLHPKLVPSDAERQLVRRELSAKLKERRFFGGWGRGSDERQDQRCGRADRHAADGSSGENGAGTGSEHGMPAGDGQPHDITRGGKRDRG